MPSRRRWAVELSMEYARESIIIHLNHVLYLHMHMDMSMYIHVYTCIWLYMNIHLTFEYACISVYPYVCRCVQLVLANIIYYRFIVYVTEQIVCGSKFKIRIKADPYPFLSHSPVAVINGHWHMRPRHSGFVDGWGAIESASAVLVFRPAGRHSVHRRRDGSLRLRRLRQRCLILRTNACLTALSVRLGFLFVVIFLWEFSWLVITVVGRPGRWAGAFSGCLFSTLLWDDDTQGLLFPGGVKTSNLFCFVANMNCRHGHRSASGSLHAGYVLWCISAARSEKHAWIFETYVIISMGVHH